MPDRLEIQSDIAEGEPWRRILEGAVNLPADLLVMGTHGRSGWERVLMGSTTEKVIHRAPCPVLTIGRHDADPSRLFRRVSRRSMSRPGIREEYPKQVPRKARRFIRPRAAAVIALMDPALDGDTSSQHRFRVAARSLRANLPVLWNAGHAHRADRIQRDLRCAIRALADVRDIDVGRAILMAPRRGGGRSIEFLQATLPLMDRDRAAAMTKSRKAWPRHLGRRLTALLAGREPELQTMRKRARREARKQRLRALALLKRLRRFDPIRLHEVRKGIRRLRYALDLLQDLDSHGHTSLGRLEALQGRLGDAQDRVVLSRWLTGHARHLGPRNALLAREIRHEAAALLTEGMTAWAEFRELDPLNVLEGLAVP